MITIKIKENCKIECLTQGKIYPVIDMPSTNFVWIIDDNGEDCGLDYRDDFFTFISGDTK